MEPAPQSASRDATRTALAMVRADWQGDAEAWRELYAVCDDPAELALELTHLCRETLDQLAAVAGISSGEMIHRLATRLIPHPDAGHVTLIELDAHAGDRARAAG